MFSGARDERGPGRTDVGRPKTAFADDWAEIVPELGKRPGDHFLEGGEEKVFRVCAPALD
jgi:hypothetical protein